MKNELFYPGSSIREQIKAGGADDWQLRLGHYVVSLRYVTPERRGALSRLSGYSAVRSAWPPSYIGDSRTGGWRLCGK